VSYPVGRSAALARVLLGLAAAGWLALGLTYFLAPELIQLAPAAMLSIAINALVTLGLWRFWRAQEARQLRWTGERWLLHTPGTEPDRGGEGAGVEVRLDAQRWLLLRFRDPAEAGAHWLWAQASHDPARWHLLRCALYSAAPSPAATQASRP